jgi:transposase-like protein
MNYTPPFCPRPECPTHSTVGFRFRRNGVYQRLCDRVVVPRFKCLSCGKGFSRQTFRVNYRLHRPELDERAAWCFVSKVTMRQAARFLGCRRETIELRLRRFGIQGWAFHAHQLLRIVRAGGIEGDFQLDELETFEGDRRLAPVTVPVLIHQSTRMILHSSAGRMGARGNLSPHQEARRRRREGAVGRRTSESARVVRHSLLTLRGVLKNPSKSTLRTDEKRLYTALLRRLSIPIRHEQTNSKKPRTTKNPLFPINHTLAMMRDGVSRLVRRSWGASKMRERLTLHLGFYMAWRNYVRRRFNRDDASQTPGQLIGLMEGSIGVMELLGWTVFPWRLGRDSLHRVEARQ